MFINCPYCSALVATDPVNDLPPTHCPHCASLLRRDETVVDDETVPARVDLGDLLQASAGQTAHEDSRNHLAADITTTDGIATDMDFAEHAPADTSADDAPCVAGVAADVAVAAPSMAAVNISVTTAPVKRRQRATPSFVRGVASTGTRERWGPVLAIALALLLALQLLLADRARLAANPQWRPLLTVLCNALACRLPPWREPAAFTLLQRDVRQHPSIPGALRVSATFRNDARWPQPWPQLRLSLSDANGRAAGERSFRADEYLGGPATQAELASGESATVAMDVLEPAARIVAYDFSFR